MATGRKDVTLRAFRVINNNTDLSTNPQSLLSMLTNKINGSIVSTRKMLLNQDDPSEEADMMTNYVISTTKIFGTIFRVLKSENVSIFPENLMEQETISMEDLSSMDNGNNVIKNQYYFLINNEYLITNFYHKGSIYPFETYLNWLLNDIRTNIIGIIPHVVPPPDVKLTDIKEVIISDSFISHAINASGMYGDRTENVKIPAAIAKQLLSDTDRLTDIELEQIIVAELKVRFKKPTSMDKNYFQDKYGALLKPISDLDSVKFTTRGGKNLSGENIVKTKKVQIELTETGKLSEPNLSQEMERFLGEIS